MNAREKLYAYAGTPSVLPERMLDAALDAYRAEVLADAKTETVAWLVKKAAERGAWDAAVLASKVDRGAVRAFLGTDHYRDAMDAHRAEVLAEAAAELERIADTIEARVAEHYGLASGIGPGSAQMLRDAAGNVRYMAGKGIGGGTQPHADEPTQPAQADSMPAIRAVLADFNFESYGLDVDPHDGHAEWVGDLAAAIAGALPAAGDETEQPAQTDRFPYLGTGTGEAQ